MGARIFGFIITVGIFGSFAFAIADCKDKLFKPPKNTTEVSVPLVPRYQRWNPPQLLDQRSELHASLKDAGSLNPLKRARGYKAIMDRFHQALNEQGAQEAIEIFFVTLEFIKQKRPKRDSLTRIRIALQAESNGFYMDGGVPVNADTWAKYLPFQMSRYLISRRLKSRESGENRSDARLIEDALDYAKVLAYPSFRGQPYGR